MEIRIEHLSMTYPSGKQALKDLNLELKAPSLIGLLGPNGAGKRPGRNFYPRAGSSVVGVRQYV